VSYTVDIWAHSFPAGDVAAWELRNRLLEERDAQRDPDTPFVTASPEMAELHRRLTARFPCICDDDAGPWSDGPLINNFGPGRAVLGISFSRVAEALPFVIDTATGMGFHVFDGQDQVIHRPAGFVGAPHGSSTHASKPPRKWWEIWR
jgi:hypothetical protein